MLTDYEYTSDSDWGDSVTEKWQRDLELWSKENKTDINGKTISEKEKRDTSLVLVDQTGQLVDTLPSVLEDQEKRGQLNHAVPSTSKIRDQKGQSTQAVPSTLQQHGQFNNDVNEEEEVEVDVVGLDDPMQEDYSMGIKTSVPLISTEKAKVHSSYEVPCRIKKKKKYTKKRCRRSKRLSKKVTSYHGQDTEGEASSSSEMRRDGTKVGTKNRTSKLTSIKSSRLEQDSNFTQEMIEIQGHRAELREMDLIVKQLKNRVNSLEHANDECVLRSAVVTRQGELLEKDIDELKSKVRFGAADVTVTGTTSVARASSAVGVSHYQLPWMRDDDNRILDDLIGSSNEVTQVNPPTSSAKQSQSERNGNFPAAKDKPTTSLESRLSKDPITTLDKSDIAEVSFGLSNLEQRIYDEGESSLSFPSSQSGKKYQCFFCEHSFFQKAILIRHLSSAHRYLNTKDQEKPCTSAKAKMLNDSWKNNYHCCFCGQPFGNKTETHRHITREHKDKFP